MKSLRNMSNTENVIEISSDSADDIIDLSLDPLFPTLQSIFPQVASSYLNYLLNSARKSLPNDNSVSNYIVTQLLSEKYPTNEEVLNLKQQTEEVVHLVNVTSSDEESHTTSLEVCTPSDTSESDTATLGDNNEADVISNIQLNTRAENTNKDIHLNTLDYRFFESIFDQQSVASDQEYNYNWFTEGMSNKGAIKKTKRSAASRETTQIHQNENRKRHGNQREQIIDQPSGFIMKTEVSSTSSSQSTTVQENERSMSQGEQVFHSVLKEVNGEQQHKFAYEKTYPSAAVTEGNPTLSAPDNLPEVVNLTMTRSRAMSSSSSTNNLENDESAEDIVLDSKSEEVFLKILPIFPDICPTFLRKTCKGQENNPIIIERLISFLIQTECPKRKINSRPTTPEPAMDLEEQYKLMLNILPDADPTYLRFHCSRLINTPDQLMEFTNQALEGNNYPTLRDYKRKEQLSAQVREYTTDFNLEKYLELIPNPKEYFNDQSRTIKEAGLDVRTHSLNVFRNLFPHIKIVDITEMLKKNKYKLLISYNILKQMAATMKTPRKFQRVEPYYNDTPNIPFLQEMAYIQHMEEIDAVLVKKENDKISRLTFSKNNNLLIECLCCYDNELLEEDTVMCPNEHHFCKECVNKSVEVAFSENKLKFICLADCTTEFTLATLQKIVQPKLFSKLALRKQLEEVKAAGVDELESCPFCDFANIPNPDDKVFRCLNSECMRESCRLCRESSHIPLRCDEVEKPEELKARHYIEDKMTEALLRKCWKCGVPFIKEEGCNKMTCTACNALMCYVCGKPVQDYTHFNGQGGTEFNKCPLYNDTVKLHLDNVRKVGEEAKREVENKNIKLKFDPLTTLPSPPKEDRVYRPGTHDHEHIRMDQIVGNIHFRHYHNHHHHREDQHRGNGYFYYHPY